MRGDRLVDNILYIPLIGVTLGIAVCALLHETAPRKDARSADAPLAAAR